MSKYKSNTKTNKLLDEKKENTAYIPSDKEREVITRVFHKFRLTADNRNRTFSNFDGDDLITYIEDSVRRYVTNVDARSDIEDWQARVHEPFTRNKVLAILGKLIQILPIARFKGRGTEDTKRVSYLNDMYQYSEEIEDYEEFMINYLEEAIVKGTAIGYEGHEKKIREIKNIKNSGDEIKQVTDLVTSNRLYHKLIKLENFYPSSVSIRRIRDMPFCFVREIISGSEFAQNFSMFSKSSIVQPQAIRSGDQNEKEPYYLDYVSGDVSEGDVEVIYYYNKDVDEYIIIANGVWLNPLIINEKEEISGIPFNHKELPFFEFRLESFGNNFFYGKSLPDKLKSMQDVLNVLTNMLLDQSFLTIFAPILTNGFDSIEDDYLRPGRRTPIDTQGLSIKDSIMKLDLGTPTGWHQFILEYTRKIMEEASVDKVSQGIAGVGERTTAQEIRVAASGVASMLGIPGRLARYSIKRKALLRGKNILQIWTSKDSPIVEKLFGEGGTDRFNKAFNIIEIDNATLTSGNRGKKIIEIYAEQKQMPTANKLKARATVFEAETGKKLEIVAIPAKYLRDFEFDVETVVNPKSEETQDVEKALVLEKARVYLSFFPEFIDKRELAAQVAEKFGDDPTKILTDGAFPGFEQKGASQKESASPAQTLPSRNTAGNIINGLVGGQINGQ